MKTIKDVIAAYPDGWPIKKTSLYWNAFCWNAPYEKVDFCNQEDNLVNGCYLICTREEYEQALKESKMESKCDWYDYESGKSVMNCPLHIEVINPRTNEKALVLYHTVNESEMLITLLMNKDRGTNWVSSEDIKPLDHDKHQVKTVSLDWLVGSGIDAEFDYDGNNRWRISQLAEIQVEECIYNESAEGAGFDKCRPRMNQPMVLTDEQVNLIPDGFDYEIYSAVFDTFIVTFKGLKDGYKYEWEA